MPNALGLSRNIPSDIKRAVRQRCGFGCVVCGASIYEYDHFDPRFAEAKTHDSDGITLLCPTHHSEKTRGILPLDLVRKHNSEPVAVKEGKTSIVRPYFEHLPTLAVGGGATIKNTPIPIMVAGVPLIEFLLPESGSHITRINANITSDNGASLLRIRENEWIVETGVWHYEWVGQRMTIKDDAGQTSLQITVHPPKLIEIDRLRFNRDGYDVEVTRTQLRVNTNIMQDCVFSDNPIGMVIGALPSRTAGSSPPDRGIPEGFEGHNGGPCPIHPLATVICVIRTAEGLGFSLAGPANRHEWEWVKHPDGLGRVVAYKVADILTEIDTRARWPEQ